MGIIRNMIMAMGLFQQYRQLFDKKFQLRAICMHKSHELLFANIDQKSSLRRRSQHFYIIELNK